MHIRKISEEEIPLIRQLALKIWPKTFEQILSATQISYMLNLMYSHEALAADMRRGVQFYIPICNHSDCGYAAIENLDSIYFKLHKIYVSHAFHGKGLGKFLIQQMEHTAKDQGGSYLKLNVNRQNPAIHFYKKHGYHITHAEDIDISNGFYMNDYVMEKKLFQ